MGAWAPAIFKADESEECSDGPLLYVDHNNCGDIDNSEGEVSKYPALIWMEGGSTVKHWTSLPDEYLDGRLVPAARRTGKKAAGRQLDGREWNQFPEALT